MSTILRLHLALQTLRLQRELRKTPRTVTVRPSADREPRHIDHVIAAACAIGLVILIAEAIARRWL